MPAKINRPSKKLVTDIVAIKSNNPVQSNALEIEDNFKNHYFDNIINPDINPEQYYGLVEENNTLGQCITAMEVNIDGTGQEIVRADKEKLGEKDLKNVEYLNQFLAEVYPLVSFTTLRRTLRREAETTGYACMEVIRNPKGDIVFLRALSSKKIRLLQLGEPIESTKSLTRGGETIEITMGVRDRVFVQLINNRKIYFSEYASSRHLDKYTGEWADSEDILPAKNRASEILYFTVNVSSKSSYGVPRWLNQIPSVVGSRAAEELNLEFFKSGGIPPVMIFISGGQMGDIARQNLQNMLNGSARHKLKAIVADIQSSGGTIDKAGAVSVKVEKFGSAKQNDSMFENYDDKCEKRVRASFRLPPLFLGKADDYSYASVFASYTVAEAQVFAPERMEFDTLINATIMKELSNGEYKIESKPLTVSDASTDIEALKLAITNTKVTPATIKAGVNSISSLNIPIEDEDYILDEFELEDMEDPTKNPLEEKPPKKKTPKGKDKEKDKDKDKEVDKDIDKSETPLFKTDISYISMLANTQLVKLDEGLTKQQDETLLKAMEALNPNELNLVYILVSNKLYASMDNDPDGMAELCECLTP
jgi:PBSX family phage portal protein